jgi:hypothetical protein
MAVRVMKVKEAVVKVTKRKKCARFLAAHSVSKITGAAMTQANGGERTCWLISSAMRLDLEI